MNFHSKPHAHLAIMAVLALSAPACADDSDDSAGETEGETETSSGTDGSSSSTSDGTTGTDGSTGTEGTTGTDSDGTDTEGDTDGTTGGMVDDPWEIELEHAGGEATDVVVDGDLAFAAIGNEMVIWDIADRNAPAIVGRSGPFDGMVRAVEVDGSTAYVAEAFDLDGRLHVMDVSDPSAPAVLGQITYSDSEFRRPTDLEIAGDRLYLTDQEIGLVELDRTDPTAPTPLGSLPEPGMTHVQRVGDRLYIGIIGFVGTAVAVLDATNNLGFLGFAGVPNAIDLAFTDGDLVVGTGGMGTYVYDLADPSMAQELYSDPNLLSHAVNLNGDQALIADPEGLHALDLSNPAAITDSGAVAMPTQRTATGAAAGSEQLVFTDTGRAIVLDASTATIGMMAEVDMPACSNCYGTAPMGNMLILADFYTGARIVNASDLSPVGRFELDGLQNGVEDAAFQDGMAAIADWSSGLYLLDLSDPAAPSLLSHLPTAGFPSSVELSGTWAFVGESTNAGAVRAIDISNPRAPQEAAVVPATHVFDMALAGDKLFVADQEVTTAGGVRILDIADPSQMAEVGHYTTCTSALSVAAEGNLVVAGCTDAFHFIDVTDPANPTQLATFGTGGYGVALEGDRAYLGGSTQLTVLDVSDPSAPAVLDQRNMPMRVNDITVTEEGRIAVSAGVGGLYHLEIQ